MPSDMKLDKDTNDLSLDSGTIVMITENMDVVAQRVKIAILLRQGEWFRDLTAGVPYNQQIFTVKNNKGFIDQFMVGYINSIEDVTRVLEYESVVDVSTREMTIATTFETVDGTIVEVDTATSGGS